MNQSNKYIKITKSVITLLYKMQKVDKYIKLTPVQNGKNKPLTEADYIPLCQTEMSNYTLPSGRKRSVQNRKITTEGTP